MNYSANVFETRQLGAHTVKNRLVFAATSSELADKDGYVTDDMVEYYATRARGGVGLIVVEATYVSKEGQRLGHNAMIENDARIPGLRKLASAIQEHGATVLLQLNHGGRESVAEVSGRVVAPSSIPSTYTGVGQANMPEELTREEIHSIIGDFESAARRAQAAGFDGIELHGAHGYLISQFLSRNANHRTDEYGGTLEGRARFYVQLVERIRASVGEDFIIVCRINARDGDGIADGLELSDAVVAASMLESAGADSISITAGMHGSRPYLPIAGMSQPRGLFLPFADAFRQHVTIPIMTVGRLKTADSIAQAARRADFVCLSRALIADPFLPMKLAENRAEEIVPCIACNECLMSVHRHRGIVCTMNPSASREQEFARLLNMPNVRQKVVVVGGGVAGLSAAASAARRGHDVTLLESSAQLGGQLNLAHVPPNREELETGLKHLIAETTRWGVDVQLNANPTPEAVAEMRPDRILVAVGAKPALVDIAGSRLPHVVRGQDVLSGATQVSGNVVIIGGGLVGIEVADYLAEQGDSITLIARSGILTKAVHADRVYFEDRIASLDIRIHQYTQVNAITDDSVTMTDQSGLQQVLRDVDAVVLCVGYSHQQDFADMYHGSGAEVSIIGDARASRKLFEAIEEGTLAGINL